MDVLYPEGRQMLKVRPDKRTYSTEGLQSLGKITLKNKKGSSGSTTAKDVDSSLLNTDYVYTINEDGKDQASIEYEDAKYDKYISNANIDLSKVTAIRIKGYAENSATMVLNFQTKNSSGTTVGYNESGNINQEKFRFTAFGTGEAVDSDVILVPQHPELLESAGKIQKIRFNPPPSTAVGSRIHINEIEFYQGNPSVEKKVFVDGVQKDMVSKPEVSDTTYIPAYKLLVDIGAYPVWDKNATTKNTPETGALTIEKNGKTVVVTAGSKIITVNGVEEELGYAPYYKEGNLFIPYTGVMEKLGYRASLDENGDVYYTTKQQTIWRFETDNDKEGWTSSGCNVSVADGLMRVETTGNDPMIIKSLSLPKLEAKYLVIKLKTPAATTGVIRLHHGANLPSGGGVVYKYTTEASDEIQTFVYDLANDYESDYGTARPFSELGDTITQIRVDTDDTGNANGSVVCIDSIEITDMAPPVDEEPNPTYDYEMVAYGFEKENMFDLLTSKIGTGYTNLSCSNGTTGNDAADKMPPVETVDGYENVMKLVPTAGSDNGLFSLTAVWYNGSKQAVQKVREGDELVKISFWYKAVGNGTGFQIENRQGGLLDGETILKKDASATEWKYFEDYLDMSKVEDKPSWFTLRIYRNGKTVNDGGLYVRDYKLVCLDTSKELTGYNYDDTIAIVVKGYDEESKLGMMYISEHDADDDVLSKFASGKYPVERLVTRTHKEGTDNVTETKPETLKYFFYNPKSTVADEIKGFLWDEFEPLSEVFALEKN